MDYDFLAKDAPVNATAARVMQRGTHFESSKKINQLCSELPIKTKWFPGPKESDMTNTKFGRFTVTGYFGSTKGGSLWVVRCSCGKYETRKTRAIKNPKNNTDCCQYCREIQYMKKHSYWKMTGQDIEVR